MNISKKSFDNTLIIQAAKYFIPRCIIAVGYVSFIFLASSFLNAKTYNELSVNIAIATALSGFIATWVGQSLLKYSRRGENDYLQDTSAILLFLLSLSVVICVLSLISNITDFNSKFILLIAFNSCSIFFLLLLQSQTEINQHFYVELARASLLIFGNLVIFYNAPNYLDFFVYIWIFSFLISVILLLLYLFRVREFLKLITFNYLLKKLNKYVEYGGFLSLWILAFMLIPYIDRIIISESSSESLMPIYDFITRLLPFVCAPLIMTVLQNSLQNKTLEDSVKFNKFIAKSTLVILFTCVLFFLLLVLVYIFSTHFFEFELLIINKDDYFLIFLFLLSTSIWQVAMVVQKTLEKNGETREMFFAMAIILLCYILLSFLPMPLIAIPILNITFAAGYIIFCNKMSKR